MGIVVAQTMVLCTILAHVSLAAWPSIDNLAIVHKILVSMLPILNILYSAFSVVASGAAAASAPLGASLD